MRLLRVFKLKKLVYKFEEFFLDDTVALILDMIKLLGVIFFIAHWVACFFYFVADYEEDTDPNSWIIRANLIDKDPITYKYVFSLYWAFMTMTTVGYGDLAPVTMSEQIYGIVAMIIACGVFAYVVGSIGTIVNRSSTIV